MWNLFLIIIIIVLLFILCTSFEYYTPTPILNAPGRGPNAFIRQRPAVNLGLLDNESNEQYYLPQKKDREEAIRNEKCLEAYHKCLDKLQV